MVNNIEWTALICLFYGLPEKTDFDSNGFRLLWGKENDIKIDVLNEKMRSKKNLRMTVIAATSDTTSYF